MGLRQIILENYVNLSKDDFTKTFGYNSKDTKSINVNTNTLIELINISSKNYNGIDKNIIVSEKEYYSLGFITDNLIYIQLPELPSDEKINFVKNYYLHLISKFYSVSSKMEQDGYVHEIYEKYNIKINVPKTQHIVKKNHNKIDWCVNTLMLSVTDSKQQIIEKYLEKNGLCVRCYEHLSDEGKNLIGNMRNHF